MKSVVRKLRSGGGLAQTPTLDKKFLHHSTSSFLVACSIFKTTSHQFPGRRPEGKLTRGTRARTKTMAKKFLHHSTSSFLVPCSIFQTTSHHFAGRRPNGMLTRGTRARTQTIAYTNDCAKKVPSSFNFLIPCSLFLVQYSKQLHINSQAGGLMVCSLAGRERGQKRWRKNSFIIQLPHSSFLVPCSIFQTTSCQLFNHQ
jgi:hypothetical protein